MSRADGALVTAPPRSGDWEFGGHPYALEPLALPERWVPRTAARATAPALCPSSWRATARVADSLLPADGDEIDRVFWFRWITGHQTTFVLWQLLAATVDEAAALGADQEGLARQARMLVRGYSLMLLYASSSPRDVYERVVRSPMARQHVNLSGAWARDYLAVRPLMRGKARLGAGIDGRALAAECALNERVHEGISGKVVPSGVSLLLTPNPRQGSFRLRKETLRWLYDGIFLTTRRAVPYDLVVRQLVRRLHAISLDISANGLYPAFAPSAHNEPPVLRERDVVLLKTSFSQTLLDLAGTAQNHSARGLLL